MGNKLVGQIQSEADWLLFAINSPCHSICNAWTKFYHWCKGMGHKRNIFLSFFVRCFSSWMSCKWVEEGRSSKLWLTATRKTCLIIVLANCKAICRRVFLLLLEWKIKTSHLHVVTKDIRSQYQTSNKNRLCLHSYSITKWQLLNIFFLH